MKITGSQEGHNGHEQDFKIGQCHKKQKFKLKGAIRRF